MSPMAPAAPLFAGSVRQPACLLPPASSGREPALVVLDDHLADLADLAGAHHLARLSHHRIAGVVVGHAEHRALARDRARPAHRPGLGVHQRLVAHDMEAGFTKACATGKCTWLGVTMTTKSMRSCAGPLQLVGQQRLPVAVVARVGQAQVAARGARLLGVGRQRAGHQLALAVERDRVAVHRADEGIAAAADHGVAQLAGRCIGHQSLGFLMATAPSPSGRGLG
jgi:hypothetical protein